MNKIMKRTMGTITLLTMLVMNLSGCTGCNTNVTQASATPTAVTVTVAPTEEVVPTDVPELADEPVATLTEVPAPTVEPTAIPEPAPTCTLEPTATPISTAIPVPTPTPIPTAIPKPTPSPTSTPEVFNGITAGDYVRFGNYGQKPMDVSDVSMEVVNASWTKIYARMGIAWDWPDPFETDTAWYAEVNGKGYFRFIEYYSQESTYYEFEPIEWLVLEVRGGKAFLLSKDILDLQAFDTRSDARYNYHDTWDQSEIRAWLGNEFYQRAFDEKEKKSILLTEVKNEPNSENNNYSGEDTKDKVYLLSEREALEHFGEEWILEYQENMPEQTIQLGVPSLFAQEIGAEITPNEEWWRDSYFDWSLRTTGRHDGAHVDISNSGFLSQNGSNVIFRNGIRPCMWIDLATAEVEEVN